VRGFILISFPDDEGGAGFGGHSSTEFGSIRVRVKSVKVGDGIPMYLPEIPDDSPIHEKSKKAHVHRTV
jgi:hypothetical protein